MKIKKQIEKIKGVEFVEKVDKGVLCVYLKQRMSNKDLLELAQAMYPVGTKFIETETGDVRTVSQDGHFLSDDHRGICCGATPIPEWEGGDKHSNPYVFDNGQWAEIAHPLFTTEDGVDVYVGDLFYVVYVNDLSFRKWTSRAESTPVGLTNIQFHASEETPEARENELFFSSEASAQAWIDSQKPIVFVEGEIYTSKDDYGQWIFRFKSARHITFRDGVTVNAYSCLSDKDEYEQNDWMTASEEDRTVAIASLEEKKRLIVAEVHNSYFHGL